MGQSWKNFRPTPWNIEEPFLVIMLEKGNLLGHQKVLCLTIFLGRGWIGIIFLKYKPLHSGLPQYLRMKHQRIRAWHNASSEESRVQRYWQQIHAITTGCVWFVLAFVCSWLSATRQPLSAQQDTVKPQTLDDGWWMDMHTRQHARAVGTVQYKYQRLFVLNPSSTTKWILIL